MHASPFDHHRAQLQELERDAVATDTGLLVEDRAGRRQANEDPQHRDDGSKHQEQHRRSDDVHRPLQRIGLRVFDASAKANSRNVEEPAEKSIALRSREGTRDQVDLRARRMRGRGGLVDISRRHPDAHRQRPTRPANPPTGTRRARHRAQHSRRGAAPRTRLARRGRTLAAVRADPQGAASPPAHPPAPTRACACASTPRAHRREPRTAARTRSAANTAKVITRKTNGPLTEMRPNT